MPPGPAVSIGSLTEQTLPQVIRIHEAGLGYSVNSRLGEEHMAFLYRLMAGDEHCFVGVAALNDRAVGVVSGTIDADALKTKLLRTLSLSQAAHLALACIAHPSLLLQWWQEIRIGAPVYHAGEEVRAVLTAIIVDPDAQAHGIGKQLVMALEQFLARNGVMKYRLDTLISNASARGFYARLGFSEVAVRAGSVVLLKVLAA